MGKCLPRVAIEAKSLQCKYLTIQSTICEQYFNLTFSSLTLHCHLHPLQAANCCRNSRLVVDEDDLKWVTNEKSIAIVKTVLIKCPSETPMCRKLSHSSQMQNDALIHREGLKG